VWIKQVFGFCGELWWIFGFYGVGFGLLGCILGVLGTEDAVFWMQKRGYNVVVRCKIVVVSSPHLRMQMSGGEDWHLRVGLQGAFDKVCDVGVQGGLDVFATESFRVLGGWEVRAAELWGESAHDGEVACSGDGFVFDEGRIGDAALYGFGERGRGDLIFFAGAHEDGDADLFKASGNKPEGCGHEEDERAYALVGYHVHGMRLAVCSFVGSGPGFSPCQGECGIGSDGVTDDADGIWGEMVFEYGIG
jgi:hypothetical protein